MKVAALDLGTNSFLCLIAEVEGGKIQSIISDEVQVVRLGQDVNKTREFHPEALDRARQCLQAFQKTIQSHKPEKVLAMATSAARDVKNAESLFQIGRELQIPIEIIPGEKEAAITFQGSISGLPQDGKFRAVIDIGGGSTEVIAGTHEKIIHGESLDIGAVRLTEKFFPVQPPTKDQVEAFSRHVQNKSRELLAEIRNLQVEELIAVAGTPTELAAATLGGFDRDRIDGFRFSQSQLQDWIGQFLKTNASDRMSRFRISPGRADIILAGTLILESILEELKIPSVTVSTRGVRFGVALELAKRL